MNYREFNKAHDYESWGGSKGCDRPQESEVICANCEKPVKDPDSKCAECTQAQGEWEHGV